MKFICLFICIVLSIGMLNGQGNKGTLFNEIGLIGNWEIFQGKEYYSYHDNWGCGVSVYKTDFEKNFHFIWGLEFSVNYRYDGDSYHGHFASNVAEIEKSFFLAIPIGLRWHLGKKRNTLLECAIVGNLGLWGIERGTFKIYNPGTMESRSGDYKNFDDPSRFTYLGIMMSYGIKLNFDKLILVLKPGCRFKINKISKRRYINEGSLLNFSIALQRKKESFSAPLDGFNDHK